MKPWIWDLDTIVLKALKKAAQERYVTVEARALSDKAAAAMASHAEVGAQFKGPAGVLSQRFARA